MVFFSTLFLVFFGIFKILYIINILFYNKNIMENFKLDRKQLLKIMYILFSIILLIWFSFWIKAFFQYRAEKDVEKINVILNDWTINWDNCNIILNFDKNWVLNNEFFNESKFDAMRQSCDDIFNIKNIETTEENCKNLIKENKKFFSIDYLILDDFENKREFCISKYLKVQFSTWTLFEVENDFKSEIKIDFSLDFYSDHWEENSEEFLNNRIDAKNRLKNLLLIEPEIDFTIDDIYLSPTKWILKLPLIPLTKYTISLKDFDTSLWEKTKNEKFIFTTPENKYFWMRILDKVTLYQNNKLPQFQILEYNSSKTKTKLKVCRIPEETYAKIEVYRKKTETMDVKDFFLNEIDKLKNFECSDKEIIIKDNLSLSNNWNIIFNKKDFTIKDIIWENIKTWLYFVEFSDKDDREYNWKFNYPIFFWIIDSHITMKVSKNWEAFIFVNDFEWNPLSKQKISLYLNDFKELEKNWNRDKWDYDTNYLSVLDKNIYWDEIVLWNTWIDWILKVDLKQKVWDAFFRTFNEEWEYDWEWLYKTFFVVSSSTTNLSYLNSTWNSWIAPWNFWYSVDNYYWYWENQENKDEIILDKYSDAEPEYYSHIYTDRLLYLPWETVNIKSVIRDSKELNIPNKKDVVLKIIDSNWKEIINKELEISDYWSVFDNIKISEVAPLWAYNISLYIDWKIIWWWGFSVEVFKNPKFKNEVILDTIWLNEWLVKIEKEETKKHYYWDETIYSGVFKIKWKVFSKYYNWSNVANANFTYKIYKQDYYDNSYWNDCYYWCFWEPPSEFYSEWKWILDWNWVWNFEVDVDFSSNYNDYKYIVEITVTDNAWDTISWSNSIIAKLPKEYKKYNRDLGLEFSSENKFIKSGNLLEIKWWLEPWKWSSDYNNKYLFVIKKKEYKTIEVDDIRWIKRPITRVSEKVEKVMLINDKNFSPTLDWKLRLNYKLDDVWEYVFEYWQINTDKKVDIENVVEQFNDKKILEDIVSVTSDVEVCEKVLNLPKVNNVIKSTKNADCKVVTKVIKENIKLGDLFANKKYFSVLTYWDVDWANPLQDDNKIRVIPEKISYNLWEKAKVLIRLPFNKWKILWTIEKKWVIKSEYIDVKSNVFFKEIDIDDTFVPNAYIWVVAIENWLWIKVPEYKVWYSEIVVDKTDKKTTINIKADKKIYKPRDKVTLDISVKDKNLNAKESELTVMVVDDSLISLLWNVDLNTLEKFYKKLPFQIQTSITNIAMLRNYYFSRPWVVWWSWFGNFKWWDSAVSTRNIFKNTAYFNPSVITDKNWNAKVSFDLPDNLTNFRVMVVSNSKDNLFGYSENFIEVRKNIIIEDKTPLILRDWDISSIGATIFNNTNKEIWFKLELISSVEVKEPIKNIVIPAWWSINNIWEITVKWNEKEITYKISALWDSIENSDKIENTIKIKDSPDLITHVIKSETVDLWKMINFSLNIPENTNLDKTKVVVSVSNNKLNWIEKIVTSLAQYPYWCIEQTVSTTLPNAILKKFDNLLSWIIEDRKVIDTNIEYWLERIKSMQTIDWWFAYWEWSSESNLHVTPYVLRSLVDMRDAWIKLPEWVLEKAVVFLENNFKNNNISDLEKTEILWALSKYKNNYYIWANLNKLEIQNLTDIFDNKILDRHSLIALTYSLILTDKIKYKSYIDENIVNIIKKLDEKDYNWYWDDISDKSIFASMLIDYNYSRNYIDELVWDLYDNDWSSYYYSTQSKNNAFMLFVKYIEKYSKENNSKFNYSIWKYNSVKELEIWKNKSNILKQTFNLSDIIQNKNEISFKLNNILWDRIYVDVTMEVFPEDKTKIKPYSNLINIKREVYEVIDENDITQKCDWKNDKYICIEPKWFKLVDWNVYKRGVLYKAKIIVDFKDTKNRTNLIIEDYLAWSFRIINSKFNTEQLSIKQNQNNWNWDHVEFRPDVVMANASYVWSWTSNFEYYFRPEFWGKFTQAPVVAYFMYNPKVRASTEFKTIRVLK